MVLSSYRVLAKFHPARLVVAVAARPWRGYLRSVSVSESGLSVGAIELREEIAFFLGYGRTADDWSAARLLEINSIMQSGVRRVYFPPAVSANEVGYEWSFLRPTTTLTTVDGTGDYNLPNDLGRVVGSFHYPAEENQHSISIISLGRILEMRANSVLVGYPSLAAIRFRSETSSTRVTGSRQEVLFFPEPDDAWVLSYEYEAYSGQLTDELPYPLGGMKMSELYIESCLTVAEERIMDDIGVHSRSFQTLLLDAIARDKKQGPQMFGQMGHIEHEDHHFRHGFTGGTYPITYHGDTIS